jgi:hypothetical protein
MRRLADFYLNRATSWVEIRSAHRKFIRDYNTQIHFAHRERKDNRHSPQDVLRGVLARTVPTPTLARIFFSTQFTRHQHASSVEYEDTDLALYTVAWHEDNKHITEVSNPRVIETSYRSPQLTLWTLGPDEWLLFKQLPDYAPRAKRKRIEVIQLHFPDLEEGHEPARLGQG